MRMMNQAIEDAAATREFFRKITEAVLTSVVLAFWVALSLALGWGGAWVVEYVSAAASLSGGWRFALVAAILVLSVMICRVVAALTVPMLLWAEKGRAQG